MKPGDKVTWFSYGGTRFNGHLLSTGGKGISLVDVDGKAVQVATSSLVKIEEEADIMDGIRYVLIAFGIAVTVLGVISWVWIFL